MKKITPHYCKPGPFYIKITIYTKLASLNVRFFPKRRCFVIFKEINIEELFRLMQMHDIAETTLQNGKTMVTVKRSKEPVNMKTGEVNNLYDRIPVPETALVEDKLSPAEVQVKDSERDKAASIGGVSTNHYHSIPGNQLLAYRT